MIYIAVLCNSTELLQNRSTILPLIIGPYAAATVWSFSMKALARYQVILLGEQRHNATAGVEPATSRSQVRRPTTTLPSHLVFTLTLLDRQQTNMKSIKFPTHQPLDVVQYDKAHSEIRPNQ